MENFLYFSIVVYIKAKYKNVRLPKKSDKKFKKRILVPLQNWMLKYKISHKGLTFDEFNRYFPSWLREYYRKVSSLDAGGTSKYQTLRHQTFDDTSISITMRSDGDGGSDGGDHAHIQAKIDLNKGKQMKLGKLLGSGGKSIFGSGSGSDNIEMTYAFKPINRSQW
eukprot:283107_1